MRRTVRYVVRPATVRVRRPHSGESPCPEVGALGRRSLLLRWPGAPQMPEGGTIVADREQMNLREPSRE
jgi:hypothetical protein